MVAANTAIFAASAREEFGRAFQVAIGVVPFNVAGTYGDACVGVAKTTAVTQFVASV
ncbi:MAG: hypothetical protein ACJAYU_000342 [Bradymonadia bacterium]